MEYREGSFTAEVKVRFSVTSRRTCTSFSLVFEKIRYATRFEIKQAQYYLNSETDSIALPVKCCSDNTMRLHCNHRRTMAFHIVSRVLGYVFAATSNSNLFGLFRALFAGTSITIVLRWRGALHVHRM